MLHINVCKMSTDPFLQADQLTEEQIAGEFAYHAITQLITCYALFLKCDWLVALLLLLK